MTRIVGYRERVIYNEGWKFYTCTHESLRDLVLFVQFKKREKHPWKSFAFSKVAGFY